MLFFWWWAHNHAQKQLDPSPIRQLQQFQQILMRQTSGDQANAVSKDHEQIPAAECFVSE